MSKKVLMAVSNYYTSVFQVGSHHYARAFSKLGYEVAFISFPISPFHKLVSKNTQELLDRETIYKNNGFSAKVLPCTDEMLEEVSNQINQIFDRR